VADSLQHWADVLIKSLRDLMKGGVAAIKTSKKAAGQNITEIGASPFPVQQKPSAPSLFALARALHFLCAAKKILGEQKKVSIKRKGFRKIRQLLPTAGRYEAAQGFDRIDRRKRVFQE
jgi:hypothetical protein